MTIPTNVELGKGKMEVKKETSLIPDDGLKLL